VLSEAVRLERRVQHGSPVFSYGNGASRTHPAGGRRKLPPTPGYPRNAKVKEPSSRR
jgi:hypothetical protein